MSSQYVSEIRLLGHTLAKGLQIGTKKQPSISHLTMACDHSHRNLSPLYHGIDSCEFPQNKIILNELHVIFLSRIIFMSMGRVA